MENWDFVAVALRALHCSNDETCPVPRALVDVNRATSVKYNVETVLSKDEPTSVMRTNVFDLFDYRWCLTSSEKDRVPPDTGDQVTHNVSVR